MVHRNAVPVRNNQLKRSFSASKPIGTEFRCTYWLLARNVRAASFCFILNEICFIIAVQMTTDHAT